MKKTYIAPAFEVIEIESIQMIANSIKKDETNKVNPDGAWSNSHRGDWGNIWNN